MALLPVSTQEESDAERLRNISAATAGAPAGSTGSAQLIQGDNSAVLQADPYGVQAANKYQAPASSYPTSYNPQNEIDAQNARFGTAPTIGQQIETETGPVTNTGLDIGDPSYLQEVSAPEEVDEAAIRRQQLKLHQAEIDATNQVYDQLLNEARLEGQGRLGSQRAGAARGGLLGSDFAGAQKDKTQKFNTDITRGIQAERMASIGAIMGEVRSSVRDEIALKNEAKAAGAEEYSNYLSSRAERKTNYTARIAQGLLTQGQDIAGYSDEELDELGKDLGIKAKAIRESYFELEAGAESAEAEADLKTRKTESEIAKNTASANEPTVYKEGDVIVNADGTRTKIGKTTAPKAGVGSDKIYTIKDMPGDIRTDLLDDIQFGLSEGEIISLYPDVNLETIQELYGQFAPLEEGGNFWDFLPGVGE